MNQKSWNKLTREQKGIMIERIGGYYKEYNSLCSWGKLTSYVQELLSLFDIEQDTRIADTIFFNGQSYSVEVTTKPDKKIAVYETYQDSNNKWHVRITPKYFITGEEVESLFMEIGSDKMYNILEHLKRILVI